MDGEVTQPLRIFPAALDEELGHPELGKGEGDEDVDRVHDHKGRDRAAGVEQKSNGGYPHQEDAVAHGQAHRQGGEAVREPGVDGHVGHDPRTVHEAGLGRHQQQGALGEDGDERDPVPHWPVPKEGVGQYGVEGLPLHRFDTHQRLAEKEYPGGEGQRGGHVDHGALACLDSRFAHDLQTVGDRLDPGVGTAPQGVGTHEEEQDAEHADAGKVMLETCLDIADQRAAFFGVGQNPIDQHQNMTGYEGHEDRDHDRYGLLDTADVEDDQDHRQETGHRHLVVVVPFGNVAEDRIAAGGDGDGDGHHVVHQQGAARDHAGLLPQHVGGHDVTAATMREVLDDARIGIGDDEDRQRGVFTQGAEGLLGTIGRGGQSVGSQTDPGQNRDQGQLVKQMRIFKVFRAADYGADELLQRRCYLLSFRPFHHDPRLWRYLPLQR